jgi:hypothetical protein
MHRDLSTMRMSAMLEQKYALPGAEQGPPFRNRNIE